jgi:hypothetical protein
VFLKRTSYKKPEKEYRNERSTSKGKTQKPTGNDPLRSSKFKGGHRLSTWSRSGFSKVGFDGRLLYQTDSIRNEGTGGDPKMNASEEMKTYFANAKVPYEQPVQDSGWFRASCEVAKTRPIKTIDPEADEEFRSLVKHELRRGESLMQFVARTGLGKATIKSLQMTASQISSFCLQAEKNAAEDFSPAWRPRTIPSKM